MCPTKEYDSGCFDLAPTDQASRFPAPSKEEAA